MKNNVLIIGNFSFGKDSFNGQTAKTRDYYFYIRERYGKDEVVPLDTAQWRKKPVSSYIRLFRLCAKSKNAVLLLGANAAQYIVPVVCLLKKIFKISLFWSVVGGSLIYDKKAQKRLLKHFNSMDAIYFETNIMADYFKDMGYKNILYAPVFSKRSLTEEFNPTENDGIMKFCTYSRVCKEKGISEAINAVKLINKDSVKCTLDIFGKPYPEYEEEFNAITEGTEGFIFKRDYLSGDNVIDVLSQFDAMLFPTYYSGEGFPIGVVECYLGGVPVIASNWHYNGEIIKNGDTGFIFESEDKDGLVNCIEALLADRQLALKMRKNAYKYSEQFKPDAVLSDLYKRIDGIGE